MQKGELTKQKKEIRQRRRRIRSAIGEYENEIDRLKEEEKLCTAKIQDIKGEIKQVTKNQKSLTL